MKRRNFFGFLMGGLVVPMAAFTRPTISADKKHTTSKEWKVDLDSDNLNECSLVTYIIPKDSSRPSEIEDFESYYQWEPQSITKSHRTYILKRI